MRQEADDRRPLLQLAFQFGDQSKGLHTGVVQIEDDQRRLLFPVLLHLVHHVFVGLYELDFDVELARRLLDLRHEKQVFNECKDAGAGVGVAGGKRLGFWLRILRSESGTLPPALTPVVAGERGAVAVIHRRRIDAVFIFPAHPMPGALSTLMLLTTSSPPPSSSSATGGSSWSCVHSPLN